MQTMVNPTGSTFTLAQTNFNPAPLLSFFLSVRAQFLTRSLSQPQTLVVQPQAPVRKGNVIVGYQAVAPTNIPPTPPSQDWIDGPSLPNVHACQIRLPVQFLPPMQMQMQVLREVDLHVQATYPGECSAWQGIGCPSPSAAVHSDPGAEVLGFGTNLSRMLGAGNELWSLLASNSVSQREMRLHKRAVQGPRPTGKKSPSNVTAHITHSNDSIHPAPSTD
ncbi:hypothetical protein BCR34DRAFT_593158 [Clohesyomyces aquaticus]|uniref:Uncharacterized protein n=1 Tax=Clohesyomyces aquaticus TaxID=1231657 RepID=A0A1Y1YLI1_9PLEO|nr:hypothetical protein BCR34DRAFT_593158 [Clohesyomyces aquaticus]